MTKSHSHPILRGAAAVILGIGLSACGGPAPAENKAAADEVAAAWVKAFDTGDAVAVAALYAEDAHSMPPGGAAITGRSAIESYWRQDIGAEKLITKLTPSDSIAQGDLLHVDGSYEVAAKDGSAPPARGQYQQLWRKVDGQWKVQHEIWRLDPTTQRDIDTADRLSSLWTTAYNNGDAAGLIALYDQGAALSQPTGSVEGRDAIGAYWKADFGTGKPATKLSLTDVYMSGDLAHLEGEYEVTDKGQLTKGHYVQLWMRDGPSWRIHREMWWR
jgi:ketosteroid isomerase-like protein